MTRFVRAVGQMKMGASYDFGHEMGSLTSAEQLEVTKRHVDNAVAAGATVLAGGHGRPELGPFFFEPTVLAEVSSEMTCFAEETFGPVVSVYRFTTDDEAIERANDTRYGLNASVWSRSSSRGRDVASRLRRGAASTPRWAAWVTRAWAVATVHKGSRSTPRSRPSPVSASSTSPRRFVSSATEGSLRS